jgi:hypothetical protein
MTRHSLGTSMFVLGWIFLMVRIEIQNQMQRIIARRVPPKTNHPFQNFREATDRKRVRREYERLFPARARWKFIWMRVTTIAAAVCAVIGIVLLR